MNDWTVQNDFHVPLAGRILQTSLKFLRVWNISSLKFPHDCLDTSLLSIDSLVRIISEGVDHPWSWKVYKRLFLLRELLLAHIPLSKDSRQLLLHFLDAELADERHSTEVIGDLPRNLRSLLTQNDHNQHSSTSAAESAPEEGGIMQPTSVAPVKKGVWKEDDLMYIPFYSDFPQVITCNGNQISASLSASIFIPLRSSTNVRILFLLFIPFSFILHFPSSYQVCHSIVCLMNRTPTHSSLHFSFIPVLLIHP